MAESEPFIISARDSRQPSLPKQMTNLRVPLKRGDGRAQSMRYETFVISVRDSLDCQWRKWTKGGCSFLLFARAVLIELSS